MRILAIGAHADDVEMGCGGSLLKWCRDGHEAIVYVATDSGYTNPDGRVVRKSADALEEARESAARIGARLVCGGFETLRLPFAAGLTDALVGVVEEAAPDLVLVHWSGDTHPDHRALAAATTHAARRVPSLLAYTSNWYEAERPFDARLFVDITGHLDDKLALIGLFASENARTDGAWVEHFRDLAALRGRQAGVRHAEAFEIIRLRDAPGLPA